MLAQPTRLVKPSHAPRACTTIALADSLIVGVGGVQTTASSSCETLLSCAALQQTNVARGEALRTPGKQPIKLLDHLGSCTTRQRTHAPAIASCPSTPTTSRVSRRRRGACWPSQHVSSRPEGPLSSRPEGARSLPGVRLCEPLVTSPSTRSTPVDRAPLASALTPPRSHLAHPRPRQVALRDAVVVHVGPANTFRVARRAHAGCQG
jgi:hypothetical protein